MGRGLSNIWMVSVSNPPLPSLRSTLFQVLTDIPDRTSVLFRRSLQDLRKICGVNDVLPESCTVPESRLGCVYEGTLDGSKVRIRRVRVRPGGDSQKAKEVRTRRYVTPVLRHSDVPQTFNQVAVTSKHLKHPNIVPLLGVTTEPLELISEWMPGGELPGYIAGHPDADRLSLVCFISTRCPTH